MTDNEKLIWDAAKAIAQEGRPGWDWSTAEQWEKDLALDEARAALAVFEKAHTPTDHERGALARELFVADASDKLEIEECLPLADHVYALGFRRSVAAEPSAEDWDNREDEVNGETRGFVSCGHCAWSMSRGLFSDLHEHERTHESEPQGEPSDARRAPVQASRGADAGPAGSISWAEHVDVWRVYAQKHGTRQSAERIAERGGFGYGEIVLFTGKPPRTFRPAATEQGEASHG